MPRTTETHVRSEACTAARLFDRPDALLALLAVASSGADVVSFLHLQQVLTSAMTGNTALLGLALGQGRFLDAFYSGFALLAYVLGVALAALVLPLDPRRALARALWVEAAFLAVFLGVYLWRGFPQQGGWLVCMIGCASVAMGMQSVAARQIGREGIPTVVFTSTLTSIVLAMACPSRAQDPLARVQAMRQLWVFGIYLLGAVAAGGLLLMAPALAVGMPLAAVLLGMALAHRMSDFQRPAR